MTVELKVTCVLSFAFGILLLRAAIEAQGLVERFVVRETAFTDPYSPAVLLVLGVVVLLISVLALKR